MNLSDNEFIISKETIQTNNEFAFPICDNMGFFISESYKMLRTKLALSIPQKNDNKAQVIGVTSSIAGEGKSTTSINLAYTLAEAGYKVCLVEADMRLPTIGKRLHLSVKLGLSNYLIGQSKISDVICKCKFEQSGVVFWTLTSGEPSPVPSELLLSDRMSTLITAFSNSFDYVIIDLPPVTIVNDALAVANSTDGILLVVRADYCDRGALNSAIEQMKFSKAKVLGVVCTSVTETISGSYSKEHGKYYRK